MNLPTLAVQIVRFIDPDQPGWVECEFLDAAGRRHTVRDKVPIFSCVMLDASSTYPQPGSAACEILERWTDQQGRELARITIERPDGIESREGVSEFVVFSRQISSDSGDAA